MSTEGNAAQSSQDGGDSQAMTSSVGEEDAPTHHHNNDDANNLHILKGYVTKVYDGIFEAYGLEGVRSGQIVFFPRVNSFGVVLNLNAEKIIGTYFGVAKEEVPVVEDILLGTSDLPSLYPTYKLLGRVIDPFGRFLDSNFPTVEVKKNLKNSHVKLSQILRQENMVFIESKSGGITYRFKVNEAMSSGIKIVDIIFPVGRGQRELVIGDRKTGKTTLGLEAILNQLHEFKSSGRVVICIYVAIGQKLSTINYVYRTFKKYGASTYSVVVAASASDSVSAQYMAPFSGAAIAEYFANKGHDVLIVYDDLTKHAVAYRQMSLLLRRPPGREAYPGDVFYLHSRLLERSLNTKVFGSITSLPIIETQAGDVSSYIPTNVISITDGQLFLDASLFYKNVIPSISTGLSVSRVGTNAQKNLLRKISGSLKLELALFREMEGFSNFSANLDATTQQILRRGKILVEFLKQEQYKSTSMEMQAYSVLSAVIGVFDEVNTNKLLDTIKLLFFFFFSFRNSRETTLKRTFPNNICVLSSQKFDLLKLARSTVVLYFFHSIFFSTNEDFCDSKLNILSFIEAFNLATLCNFAG